MKFKRLLTTIDAHTEGEPVRVVTGGIPNIPGKTMSEKRDFFKLNLNHLATSLVDEPRGHKDMFICILTPPVTEGAALGIIFMSPGGYINMCGHGSIGVATVAIETGMIEPKQPVTEILIDTPAGTIRPRVNVENGRAKSVTLENIPSFLYKTETISVPNFGKLQIDIAYGGNVFAIVEAKHLGIKADVAGINKVGSLLDQIKESTNQQVEVQHPEIDHIKGVNLVLINDMPTDPKANIRNINYVGNGKIDRSPCGTGTSANMAVQYAKGKLGLGETFITEGILGRHFYGKLIKEVDVGSIRAVLPEVTGSAFITGMHHFVMDDDDPFKYGFRV